MPDMIRSAALTGYGAIAREVGLDPSHMLRNVGLDRACLDNPDIKIKASAVRDLLERSAQASGVDDFGLRLASERNLSNLGPIGLIAREQPSVRQALEAMGHYMRLHNESLSVRISQHRDVAIVSLDIRVGLRAAPARQATELAVAVLYRILRMFLGPRWSPETVCFTHSRPSTLAAHAKFFGSAVAFSEDFAGIVCKPRDLDAPIAASDPAMARTAQRYLDELFERPHDEARDIAREMVCVLLPTGRCSAKRVAAYMGITRRTLDRRLKAGATTFHGIVADVRSELCVRFTAGGTRSLTSISQLLGFSSLSSFSRWYRTRYGEPASSRSGKRRASV